MLQFQLMTDQDRKEAAAIERRRAIEEERKKRIFNPRVRLIGNDIEALKQQIEEKKKLDAERKKVDQVFEDQAIKYDQISLALEQKEVEERKKLAQEINNFRVSFQKFEDRREFDLNDPQAIKKLLPARLYDEDPRIGISAAQKFEGEDAAGDERKKVQREQVKSWLDQQIEEREAADKERKAADEAYKAAVIARDERAIELDVMEKQCRKQLLRACCNFNKALADERECDKKERDRRDKEDSMAQMYNTMMSDMMTENPDVSLSNLGPNRRIGYMYKGMSKEEKAAFRQAQLAQIEDDKKRRADERRFQMEWDDYTNGTQRTIAMMDKQLARKQREKNKEIAEENKRMAVDHKNYINYLEKIVYSNKPTAAFYEQFNKSTR
ncbi:hypothetical protein ILUMI_04569 [Ignelater luminosus]|uniref:RIB43A-like with coiled-coils protein 2 n=1 Tax=Ignelater luminosus TaxID=2038154 RepID=A0A8K0DEI0_IGNLU|nr:hypothetical protein ILUMI_04569 [Ignelater luminosus]